MNLADVKEMFDYNAWANRRTFEAAAKVSAGDYHKDLKSSHGSLHGTLAHLVGAEKVWLERWLNPGSKPSIKIEDASSPEDLQTIWEELNARREKFIASLTEEKLHGTITMYALSGAAYTHAYVEMMQHLVNHSTYHRGQIAGMMRQLGSQPATTDWILYRRQVSKQST
jgi:uncharacterized damage-inducible protein DinB